MLKKGKVRRRRQKRRQEISRSIARKRVERPISERIVEAHGGTIALQSEPGRGTTVTLEFPLTPSRAEGKPE